MYINNQRYLFHQTYFTEKPLGKTCNVTIECKDGNSHCSGRNSDKTCTCLDQFFEDGAVCKSSQYKVYVKLNTYQCGHQHFFESVLLTSNFILIRYSK